MPPIGLRLHDTMTGKLTELVPKRAGEVRVYCCGPTVYDVAHVGHARAALAPDVLVRHLRSQGVRVVYARNVTDVDDKILARSRENGETPLDLSARMAALYQEDIRALGCQDPDHEPRVSDSIADIVRIIETLIANGNAYVADMPNGSKDVYYAVRSFAQYGKLSHRHIEDLCSGARVEVSEQKHDPLDFALWKGAGECTWGWDSPWGKGRPGWHIECSAMSERYLGYGFDVHCGGMDLIFPHHENEIAQSEAAHPGEGPFCSLWIHNGFVNVDKEKMAKSLGNFVTIRDVYQRNDPEALRYFLLTVHYRGPIAFETEKRDDGRVVFPGILEAERRVDYLYHTLGRLGSLAELAKGATGGDDAPAPTMRLPREMAPMMDLASAARGKVDTALDDDLNTPVALAVVGELARAGNELVDLAQKRRKDPEIAKAAPLVAKMLARALWSTVEPLGILQTPMDVYRTRTQARRLAIMGKTAEEITTQVEERRQARQAKDFARADVIRKELEALGIEVADNPTGTTWRIGV
ncbi:cysteine--tRNA ligase [Polyangium mundeleinium]|uniref:Cysteine--tRNA ligase n=1 Tax=Polyangium mundeleinium TaxID=2995306 RepID=A0ABT5EHR5_9BACT|nr:cysteine--tRNA ligase [Polyangium mundeleinium]MDC0741039.1 cysteine--tRNA ligase [Polyangium mundeleinium]